MPNERDEKSEHPWSYDFAEAVEVKFESERTPDYTKSISTIFKKPLVLVIEDDEDQLSFFQRLINKAGFEVIALQDGRKALEQLDKEVFHAVVSDIQMPKFDGMQFLKTVREKQQFSKLPIIMMTAFANANTEDVVMQLGADYFCPKKLVTTNLVRLLRQLLK